MSIGIYKITSPSGKIYIGQSSNIENRWNKYKNINNSVTQLKLYRSFKKYDIENHKFEIIEECEITELNECEIRWVLHFKSHIIGLNILKGGNMSRRGKKHSEETKKKMSEKHKGKILTQEHINNIKKSTKGIVKNQEWKDKISNNHSMNKPILQYDLDENFIKEWSSVKTVCKSNSKLCYSTICKCASGGLKSSGGYKWKYKNF